MKNKLASVCALLSVCNFAAAENSALNFGLEMGVQNYFIAPSASYRVNEYLSMKGSAGIFAAEASGALFYDLGALYYPWGEGFRASAHYGTHVIYERRETNGYSTGSSSGNTTSYSFPVFSGLSLGVGWDWATNDGGWQLDALYILTSTADDANELEASEKVTVLADQTLTETNSSTASGPDGSGSVWINLGYQF